MALHGGNDLARTVLEYEEIRALIPKFLASKAFLRTSDPITPAIQRQIKSTRVLAASNRDRAVSAIVNKACNTHTAVRLLVDHGHGDDAMALGRVLLENAVLLEWLLLDPVYRIDMYCISDALFRKRWVELIQEHFKSKPEAVALATKSMDDETKAVAAFFGNTIHKWAQVLHPKGKMQHVNVEAMMKEITATGGTPSSFQHDVVYFLHSAYVHTTATSMRSFTRLKHERYFRFDLGPVPLWNDQALSGANIFMMMVLKSAVTYIGLPEIEADLNRTFEAMKSARALASRGTSAEPPTA